MLWKKPQHPQAEREAECGVRHHQPDMRVSESPKAHHHVERDDDHDWREHVGEEHNACCLLAPANLKRVKP